MQLGSIFLLCHSRAKTKQILVRFFFFNLGFDFIKISECLASIVDFQTTLPTLSDIRRRVWYVRIASARPIRYFTDIGWSKWYQNNLSNLKLISAQYCVLPGRLLNTCFYNYLGNYSKVFSLQSILNRIQIFGNIITLRSKMVPRCAICIVFSDNRRINFQSTGAKQKWSVILWKPSTTINISGTPKTWNAPFSFGAFYVYIHTIHTKIKLKTRKGSRRVDMALVTPSSGKLPKRCLRDD